MSLHSWSTDRYQSEAGSVWLKRYTVCWRVSLKLDEAIQSAYYWGLGLLCAAELMYSSCYVVIFYGIGPTQCKSGRLEKGEKEVAGIVDYCVAGTAASRLCYIHREIWVRLPLCAEKAFWRGLWAATGKCFRPIHYCIWVGTGNDWLERETRKGKMWSPNQMGEWTRAFKGIASSVHWRWFLRVSRLCK